MRTLGTLALIGLAACTGAPDKTTAGTTGTRPSDETTPGTDTETLPTDPTLPTTTSTTGTTTTGTTTTGTTTGTTSTSTTSTSTTSTTSTTSVACVDGVAAISHEVGYATVDAAIAHAAPGAEVTVCAGTWTETLVIDHAVTLRGAGSDRTVLDGGGVGRTLDIQSDGVAIESLSIGGGTAVDGGCLYASGRTDLALRNLRLEGCEASGRGGGAYLDAIDALTVESVAFEGNTANSGGGLSIDHGTAATMTDVTSTGNVVTYAGGGLAMNNLSEATCTSCAFDGNVAGNGGGLWIVSSELSLTEGSVSWNTASYDGGGVYAYGDIVLDRTPVVGNVAASGGGAMMLSASYALSVLDSDWGLGADDNVPDDAASANYSIAWYHAGETFTCDLLQCW